MVPLKDTLPRDRVPLVTLALIAANVLVFFVVQGGGWSASLTEFGAVPCDLSGRCAGGGTGDLVSVATSMFLHGGVLHLAGNLLFLWIFGSTLEDTIGRPAFLALYLGGGVAAVAILVAADPASSVAVVGASGAISAVLGGYLVLYPRGRILTAVFLLLFFTLIELPVLLMLALWAGQLALVAWGDGDLPVLAGHLGGFLLGVVAMRLLARPKPAVPAAYRVA